MLVFNPAQCRAARALLDMTQPQLASAAGVGLSTVVDFERNRRKLTEETMTIIARALEAAGVDFTNGGEPGVKLRRKSE